MLPEIYQVYIRWEPVHGAMAYQILVNGNKVAKAGARARTTRVNVQENTVIEIVDLPAESKVQKVEFSQVVQA